MGNIRNLGSRSGASVTKPALLLWAFVVSLLLVMIAMRRSHLSVEGVNSSGPGWPRLPAKGIAGAQKLAADPHTGLLPSDYRIFFPSTSTRQSNLYCATAAVRAMLAAESVPPIEDTPFTFDPKVGRYPSIFDFQHRLRAARTDSPAADPNWTLTPGSTTRYRSIPMEVVSARSPRIFLLRDVLSAEERIDMIEYAKAWIRRSEVINKTSDVVSDFRTSFGMFIHNSSFTTNQVYRRRVGGLTGVPMSHIEATQILRYLPGQSYGTHSDYFAPGSQLSRGGNRFVTILAWLDAVGGGGATTFPLAIDANGRRAPLTFRPVPGSAAMFYSMNEDGTTDPMSVHAAQPPTPGGEKWVAVLWVRQGVFT